jgi:hypothetical protein
MTNDNDDNVLGFDTKQSKRRGNGSNAKSGKNRSKDTSPDNDKSTDNAEDVFRKFFGKSGFSPDADDIKYRIAQLLEDHKRTRQPVVDVVSDVNANQKKLLELLEKMTTAMVSMAEDIRELSQDAGRLAVTIDELGDQMFGLRLELRDQLEKLRTTP